MKKETMSPRERWLAVLNHQKPDRVPTDIWATAEAMDKLLKHLGCDHDEMLKRLHIDQVVGVGGLYVGPTPPEDEDIFGVKYRTVPYGIGVYREAISAPLANFNSVEEIRDRYTFPSHDHWDYSNIPAEIVGKEHRPIRGGGSEPFLRYKLLRGEERAFMDLAENPEIVEYVLDQLFDLAYESTRRIFEMIPGQVTITYVAEDLGSQIGLLYSPEDIRYYLLPRMKRMMDLTRAAGAFVITHSDGAVREIIPDLIATGTQMLNPIQWVCPGMEREGLKRDFGDRLVFHGAMDNQRILPFGTVEEVRKEVEDNLNTLGRDGGYVLAPCHNIQAVSPVENIVAMYEHAHAVGWY
jgi:uroporphyrinogen decarboxylase